MTILEYEAGQRLELRATAISQETGANEFYSLLQALMRKADTDNTALLKLAFPRQYKDLQDRYNAPGGVLPSDTRD